MQFSIFEHRSNKWESDLYRRTSIRILLLESFNFCLRRMSSELRNMCNLNDMQTLFERVLPLERTLPVDLLSSSLDYWELHGSKVPVRNRNNSETERCNRNTKLTIITGVSVLFSIESDINRSDKCSFVVKNTHTQGNPVDSRKQLLRSHVQPPSDSARV